MSTPWSYQGAHFAEGETETQGVVLGFEIAIYEVACILLVSCAAGQDTSI